MSREFSMNNPENKTLAEIRAEAWQQGREEAIKEYKQSEEYIKEGVQRYLKGKSDGIEKFLNQLKLLPFNRETMSMIYCCAEKAKEKE